MRSSGRLLGEPHLADLEDALVVAEYKRRVADGTARYVSHDDARRRLATGG